MKQWLLFSLAALLSWGAWGIFANLTARHLRSYSAIFWEVVGAATVALVVLVVFLRVNGLETPPRGVTFGVLTGVTYTVGLVFLFYALRSGSGGSVHTILIITAMYPLISAVLNYAILSEPINGRQLLGIQSMLHRGAVPGQKSTSPVVAR